MKKVSINVNVNVILNLEEDEELEDIVAELEVIHSDNTRISDYTLGEYEVEDSR